MLEWIKKENSAASLSADITDSNSPASDAECLAKIFNKKITLMIDEVPADIGTDPNAADVHFFHNSVDSVHCTLDCHNRQFTLTDHASREGTKVNGFRLEPEKPYRVEDGDAIVLGKVQFEISINYEELAKRERAALPAEAQEKHQERTYTVMARAVNAFEYEESEVVMIPCGFEPEKKEAKRFTQKINAEYIKEALKAAEEKKAAQYKILKLSCVDGIDTGEEIMVERFPFTIGRSKSSDYVLKINKISREHVRFTEKEGLYYITDTFSTNGVRVNGIKIEAGNEYRIDEGDMIQLSDNVYSVSFVTMP